MSIEVEALGVVLLLQQHHWMVNLLCGVVLVAGTVRVGVSRDGRVLGCRTVEDLPRVEEIVVFL